MAVYQRRLITTATRALIGRSGALSSIDVPLFLCPALAVHSTRATRFKSARRCLYSTNITSKEILEPGKTEEEAVEGGDVAVSTQTPTRKTLPIQCPGCGGLTQSTTPDEAGFFTLTRRSVRRYIDGQEHVVTAKQRENDIITAALESLDANIAQSVSLATLTNPTGTHPPR